MARRLIAFDKKSRKVTVKSARFNKEKGHEPSPRAFERKNCLAFTNVRNKSDQIVTFYTQKVYDRNIWSRRTDPSAARMSFG